MQTQFTLDLRTNAPDNSKQQSIDLLEGLIAQLPAGYLSDILTTEAGDIRRAIANDVCFIDYRAQITAQQEHHNELKVINEQITAARKELAAKEHEIRKALVRLSDIEDARKELRNLLKAV